MRFGKRAYLVLSLVLVSAFALSVPALADAPSSAAAVEVVKASAGVVEGCAEGAPPPANFAEELQLLVKQALESGDIVWALLLVLLAGFGVTLTPCVYPLIPITLSLFGARQSTSKLSGFLLSATYVGGMVLLYSALGIGFALAGQVMGSAMQSPAVTAGVALFCVVMAASMFGAFELALPSSLQQKLTQVGGAGFRGAFLMGLVAGLIAAPCTGPVLSFILTLIAVDGDVGRGALFMVVFALGIGIPFLVLGTFSSAVSRIPKTGAWTEGVKTVFGLLMVAAGLYFLTLGFPSVGHALAGLGTLGIWLPLLFVVLGVALGALHLSFKYTTAAERARKGVGLALCLAGVAAFIGLTQAPEHDVGAQKLVWEKVGNADTALEDFDATLARAESEGRPVMIDFFADWCAACKELDKYTYSDPAVQSEAQRFTSVKVDATDDTEDLRAIQKRFGVVGLPTVAFVNSKGQTCAQPRVTGFVEPDKYLPIMQGVW